MAHALVSFLVNQLGTVIKDEIQQEVRLVVGVKYEINKLAKTFKAIQAVLKDAENKQFKDELVKLWLEDFKDVAYDMDDVLDEWRTEMLIKSQTEGIQNATNNIVKKKVHSFLHSLCSCSGEVGLRHDIGARIKNIRERVDFIASEKDKYRLIETNNNEESPMRLETSSLIDESVVYGRQIDKDIIISKLLDESGGSPSTQQQMGISHPIIISIVGMGGLGKTTLAQLVFNDEQVKNHFEKTMWVSVSDPFDLHKLSQAIIKAACDCSVHGNLMWNIHNSPYDCSVHGNPLWNEIHNSLYKSLKGKRFLLVLDDVWNEDSSNWEPMELALRSGAPGSRILVTTRNIKVANIMSTTSIYNLNKLSDDDCWSIIRRIAFVGKEKKEEEITLTYIGIEIARKCKGLPLAAKALGSLLRFKNAENDWENVLKSEIWEIKEVENDFLKPALLLSYFNLPSPLKLCFTYCSIFPKDFSMEKNVLIKLWMAQGFLNSTGREDLEVIGEEYFNNLVMRSFFQDIKFHNGNISTCKMHDLLHDFAQFLMKNECYDKRLHEKQCNNKIRHLTLMDEQGAATFDATAYKTKNLRTIQLLQIYIEELRSSFFSSFSCLRVLRLENNNLNTLPSEIGSLIHLRYLDLSNNNELMELPESITTLYNLQTLELGMCQGLRELPYEIGKLINLRYLDVSNITELNKLPESIATLYYLHTLQLANCRRLRELPKDMWRMNNLRHLNIQNCDYLDYLPQGMGKLTSLRTLNYLPLRRVTLGSCMIEELKDLNHLEGELKISGLCDVKTENEALEVRLKDKKHLRVLEFDFRGNEGNMKSLVVDRMYNVLKGLQPHPKLEELNLCYYLDSKFPSWIGDYSLLARLKVLRLTWCENCIELPALGRLPSLEELSINKMNGIKQIGLEAYQPSSSTGTFGGGVVMNGEKLFPKLKQLVLDNMATLEELGNGAAEEGGIEIMSCLVKLEIGGCPKLKSLPRKLLNLEYLEYKNSPSLSQFPSIPKLKLLRINAKLPQGLLAELNALETLEIIDSPELTCVPEEVKHLTNLQKFSISKCEMLVPRCKKGEGEDWSIISHIPNIYINNEKIW